MDFSNAAPASGPLDRQPASQPQTFTAYLNALKANKDEGTGDACCAVRILDLDPALPNHGLNSFQSTAAKNDTTGKDNEEVCCDPRIVTFIEKVRA